MGLSTFIPPDIREFRCKIKYERIAMKRGEPKFFALKDRMRDGETDKEMNRDG